jgi:hypothetical protein
MDRNVPSTGSEEIELYLRTYYSLLRTSDDVQIKTLTEAYTQMNSSLHPLAQSHAPDIAAFTYALLRLPSCLRCVRLVVLGQSGEVFERHGYNLRDGWQAVNSPARRRRCFYDGRETLAAFIASHSDIDDLIPTLTAYQIEWNKFHTGLRGFPLTDDNLDVSALARQLDTPLDEAQRLQRLLGDQFAPQLREMAAAPKKLAVRLLASSLNDYRRAALAWYEHVEQVCLPEVNLRQRPVYFVSSNTHSLINLLSGFGLRRQDEILAYIHAAGHADLQAEWEDIQTRNVPSSRENFLYYALKKYAQSPEGQQIAQERIAAEEACGLRRIMSAPDTFDVDSQVMALRRLRADWMDPRLRVPEVARLAQSDAIILNIDYPLGMAAYLILTQVASRVREVRGIYIMGKAASLNGAVGDVIIPNVVYDEQSQNTYLFENCFAARAVAPHLVYGTVLDHQKAVTVRGTFLQNPRYAHVFYKENYTDIEMEAGPYLSAAFELARPKRHPRDEIVNLQNVPFDLGFLHYVSDTPLSKDKTLGSGNLSYFGMDPTYATSIAILRRIFTLEIARLKG